MCKTAELNIHMPPKWGLRGRWRQSDAKSSMQHTQQNEFELQSSRVCARRALSYLFALLFTTSKKSGIPVFARKSARREHRNVCKLRIPLKVSLFESNEASAEGGGRGCKMIIIFAHGALHFMWTAACAYREAYFIFPALDPPAPVQFPAAVCN